MPPLAGYWHSLIARHGQVWKAAYKETAKAVKAKLSGQTPVQVEYAYARVAKKQPLHPAARIRQGQSRWFSTKRHVHAAVRYLTTEASAPRAGTARATVQSVTWNTIRQSSGRAPFASTLRPNVTGGTLGRTAGGYSLGGGRIGGQRYFSHGPACQTQVVQNVSQAVRAFLVGGHKAQYNGVSPVTGGKSFKAVTCLQDETGRKMRQLPKMTPGSHVDFDINPTVTALTPLRNVAGFHTADEQHLNSDGLLDILSTDFARMLKELAAVLTDLRSLADLGDLPITYEASSLRVHFPGCDADTVEQLCEELNVCRGRVVQDEDFDAFVGTEMALLFPYAPSHEASETGKLFFDEPASTKREDLEWRNMLTPSAPSEAFSTQSDGGFEVADEYNLWESSSLESVEYRSSDEARSSSNLPLEYQEFEGIYRFIKQCNSVQRR